MIEGKGNLDHTKWDPNGCVIIYEIPAELQYLAFVSAQIVNKIILYKIMNKNTWQNRLYSWYLTQYLP